MVSQKHEIGNDQSTFTVNNESGYDVPVAQSMVYELCSLVGSKEGCTFGLIEVVFVDENTILDINREYLSHDYVTDIITFPYQDTPDVDDSGSHREVQELEGTLFCCAQRIAEQANDLGETIENEFRRVLIHGLLHLTGYNDKTDADRMSMRERENFYLKAYKELNAK